MWADLRGLVNIDRVYVTTDRDYARAWVARRGGALLRVEPRGELIPDPDTPTIGFAAEEATVLEVEESPVKMRPMETRKVFATLDPTRYDANGFMIPKGDFMADLVELGLTSEDCRQFGRWANPHRVVFRPQYGDFVYLADDFEFLHARYCGELRDRGMPEDEIERVMTGTDILDAIQQDAEENPVAWQ